MQLVGAIWIALFGILLTFIAGVIVWALAGPTLAIIIYLVAVLLFVVLPYRARTRKTVPHR